MDNSLKRVSRASPLRGCDAPSVAERSTLDHASAMSPFYLGRRLILFVGHKKYPAVDADLARLHLRLRGPVIGMPATRTPFTVPPAANSRRHCPSNFEPPAHKGMRGSPFIR